MASASAALHRWAVPRLQQLLPLDNDSLQQILTYSESLPRDDAAEHLKNLLGDGARSLEFISSFNQRRQTAPPPPSHAANSAGLPDAVTAAGAPRPPKAQVRQRGNIHLLPARQVQGHGNVEGAYVKRSEEHDYVPGSSRRTHQDRAADSLALRRGRPDATRVPPITDHARPTSQPRTAKPPPSASGPLISDSLSAKKGASTRPSSTASPAPQAKINITGGTAMRGASTALSDLDSAIRSLEIQTNPALVATSDVENERRKCNCMATRHPLHMAPNCLSCGKIICAKEGLGPCTFCNSPLLSPEEIQKVLRVLKDERGEERMKANKLAHKRAEVAQGKARAFTGRDFLAHASSARSSPSPSAPGTPEGSDDEAGRKAKAHRDKLLGFQANNARRTQIHDEAADFDVPAAGTNMWASPQERAQQLKKQQRILREMEWNAKPDYEKRHVVASIDLQGGKVVRRMAEVERPDFSAGEDGENFPPPPTTTNAADSNNNNNNNNNNSNKNPLACGLIRPTARGGTGKDAARDKKETLWRRVQMDEDDN